MSGADRSWMDNRKLPGNIGITEEYIRGVRSFVEFGRSHPHCLRDNKMRCPCLKCRNLKFLSDDMIKKHLLQFGFTDRYKQWVAHGEELVVESTIRNREASTRAHMIPKESSVFGFGENGAEFPKLPTQSCDSHQHNDTVNAEKDGLINELKEQLATQASLIQKLMLQQQQQQQQIQNIVSLFARGLFPPPQPQPQPPPPPPQQLNILNFGSGSQNINFPGLSPDSFPLSEFMKIFGTPPPQCPNGGGSS